MTLAASGTLTLTGGSAPRDVATEIGRAGTSVTLAGTSTDSDVKTLIGYAGGSVVFPNDFYGKSWFTGSDTGNLTGGGSVQAPAGANYVRIIAVSGNGSGGFGFNSDNGTWQGGNGGGGASLDTGNMACTPGQTFNYSAPGASGFGSGASVSVSGAYATSATGGTAGGSAVEFSNGSPGTGGSGSGWSGGSDGGGGAGGFGSGVYGDQASGGYVRFIFSA